MFTGTPVSQPSTENGEMMSSGSELTPTELTDLRDKLEKLRHEFETMVQSSGTQAKPVQLDEPIGRLSRMDALQQQSMARANVETARHGFVLINASLRRIRDGIYGECLECEEPIGYARLKASPESPFCVSCQGQREKSR